uniref:DUF2428 domain-containing protein n=1 Tax=Ditylenchus dipsaci TaxID=166011 RepID=A0A915ELH5_9BILA
MFTLAMEKFSHPKLLNDKLIKDIGDYFWLQLTECRHVGAFGLAADAFESFCKRLWTISDVSNSLTSPLHWLHRALDALSGKNDTQNLCSTRRSAGLPHLISSILTTQPKSNSSDASLLHSTLDILLTCRQIVEYPEREVHCVNVLKTLFSNNTHSDTIAGRMQEAFVVCLQAFRSSKSVQRGLHVEQKCKMSSTEFFLRFPQLYSLIHISLTDFNNTISGQTNVFQCLSC